MRSLLVTGGAGFIGSNFIRYLLKTNLEVQVVNLDALTYAGNPDNLSGLSDPSRYIFVEGSINDAVLVGKLLSEHSVDTVVNFAAETHVDRSIDSAYAFLQTNVMGTLALLECVKQSWLKDGVGSTEKVRFHHISTDEVYGSLGPEEPAFNETTPYDPKSPYAASKAASDHLVRAFGHTYGLPVTISNCSNNFGPYQYPEKLIPLVILNALQGKPLPIYGDGQQVRDWLFVEDHCKAIGKILDNGTAGQTYNVGGNAQVDNLSLVRRICSILDLRLPDSPYKPHASLIEFVKDRPGHDRRYAMNTEKLEEALKWKPDHSLQEGLEATIDWYLNNMDWVEKIRVKPDYQEWVSRNYSQRSLR